MNGVEFDPLPLTGTHKTSLRRVVRSSVASVPGGLLGCLSAYDRSHEPLWDVPRKILEPFRGVSLQLAAPAQAVPMSHKIWRRCLDLFVRCGMDRYLTETLVKWLGPVGKHPMAFLKSNRDPYRFAVECAVALSNNKAHAFYAAGNSIYVDVGGGEHVGVYNGVVEGVDTPMPEDLLSSLWDSRGQVVTHRFGIYDRIRIWASTNYDCMDDVDGLVNAVTLLKLSEDAEAEHDFEQTLHETPVQVAPTKKFSAPDGTIDKMRDIWFLTANSNPEKALHDVFNLFVPDCFDSQIFMEYFKVLPQADQKLTAKQMEKIDEGIHNLAVDLVSKRGL